MIYSLFISPSQSAWKQNVDEPTDGQFTGRFMDDLQENILYQRVESLYLDEGDTKSITFAVSSLQAEWVMLIARTVGNVRVDIAGFDTDGVTAITSKTRSYGNEVFPGFYMLSTYNIQTVTFRGLVDGTTVELFAGIACADNDARLVTNA